MTCDSLNKYLDNVAAYINDDDKIVTYKWFSKEMEIHVNTAKNILQKFWETHKKDVVATFLVKGELEDGSLRFEVTRETNLSAVKQKFKRLDFEHIYSLQKSLPSIDLLATAGEGDTRFSAIKFPKNVIRKDSEVKIVEKPNRSDKFETENVHKQEEPLLKKQQEIERKTKESSEESQKENVQKHKKVEKNELTKEENIDKKIEKGKTNKKPIQSTQAGFNHLFGKVGNKPKLEKRVQSTEEEGNTKIQSHKIDEEEKDASKQKDSSPESTIKPEKHRNTKQSKSNKREHSIDLKKSSNKRKRIITMFDSSEDEDNKSEHSEEEPEEIVDEPKLKRKKSPSPELPQNGHIKTRKIVSKSVMDEDGFMKVTQVSEYEHINVEEEPQPVIKKSEAPKAKKQTSLMSFFKKT